MPDKHLVFGIREGGNADGERLLFLLPQQGCFDPRIGRRMVALNPGKRNHTLICDIGHCGVSLPVIARREGA